jgi:hypothetical protein
MEAMSKIGSRCRVSMPALASARRCRVPAESTVKAAYVPRRSGGTEASAAEKSRTWSS